MSLFGEENLFVVDVGKLAFFMLVTALYIIS